MRLSGLISPDIRTADKFKQEMYKNSRWQLAYTFSTLKVVPNQNVNGRGLNEEDVNLPSHVTKKCDKSGRCQQCMVSWRILTNRTQGISHDPQQICSKREIFGGTRSTAPTCCHHHSSYNSDSLIIYYSKYFQNRNNTDLDKM